MLSLMRYMAYVWQISIVHFKRKSIIYGTILSGKPKKRKSGYALNGILVTYLRKPLASQSIKIQVGTRIHEISTGRSGEFSLECDNFDSDDIMIFYDNEELLFDQSYPLIFNNSDHHLIAVSDIDDTLLVSYTSSIWNRIRTILFTSPRKRKYVDFTKEILDAVQSNDGQIFYVSKSESNLFKLLSGVIQNHDLPNGPLFLTPFLRYSQLLNPKKGKDFKELAIKRILNNSKDKKIILIGDDSQQDINVYTNIAEQYPERIFKIYIRRTRKHLITNLSNHITKLRNLDIPFYYFDNRGDVEAEIKLIQELKN